MKVLHVIARMNVGGTARYVSQLVDASDEFLLATGYVQGSEVEDTCVASLPVVRIPHLGRAIRPLRDLRALLELQKVIREYKPDVIHSHTFKAGVIARLTWSRAKRVHTFHGHLFDDDGFSRIEKLLITLAERLLAHRADLLISVGKKVGVELREAGVGVHSPWVSIAPGVEPLIAVEKRIARAALGIDFDVVGVGWMARVTSVKNPMRMIEVAKALPEIRFWMAGGGDLLEKCREVAPPNLTVVGWADAATFWSAMDVAISTSDNEGIPIALIEAALNGLPIVATDVGSTAEIIDDEFTGYVVERDVLDLSEAVMKLVGSEPLRVSMGSAAREKALREFSIGSMVESHRSAYASL